jgi:hypothetical protein
MAGHQPELFHPGVWVKNFAINGLARAHGGLAINLVVDNDTLKTPALKVPALDNGSGEDHRPRQARLVSVPFDTGREEVPYEERHVHDETLFASFPERVASAAGGWGFEPLVGRLWEKVCRLSSSTPLVGERLVAGRRELEREWGCGNLEIPVSMICGQDAFAWFACDLLTNLPRFHRIYNEAVHAYRRRNGLRSRNHPVPDLAVDGDWFEAPFWAWRTGPARRGRLFARRSGQQMELRAGQEWATLPVEPLAMIDAWHGLSAGGFKVRSRALTNTLYARLMLCDLFVHGIGGGKYDELTDELMSRYFGIQPPAFLVLSATVYLPLPTFPVQTGDCQQLAHDLRDVRFNPQRHRDFAAMASATEKLLEEKQTWIDASSMKPGTGYERYRALRRLNSELEPFFTAATTRLRNDLKTCEEKLASNAVLRRRDYSFCLYPEATLRPFCEQFLR